MGQEAPHPEQHSSEPQQHEIYDPPIESEEGPIGFAIDIIGDGIKGVAKYVVEQGVVHGAEAVYDSWKTGRANESYETGIEQGGADAEAHMSTPTRYAPDHKAYQQGYDDGVRNQEEAEAGAAGYRDGLADAAHHQESPVPAQYQGQAATYSADYERAQTAYQAGEDAGRYGAEHHQDLATPPEYQGNQAYAAGYAEGSGEEG